MRQNEFDSKYPLDLQAKYDRITGALKAGDRTEAARLAESLSSAQKEQIFTYNEDLIKLNATLKQEIADLESQNKAIIHNQALKATKTFSSYSTSDSRFSDEPKKKKKKGCAIM